MNFVILALTLNALAITYNYRCQAIKKQCSHIPNSSKKLTQFSYFFIGMTGLILLSLFLKKSCGSLTTSLILIDFLFLFLFNLTSFIQKSKIIYKKIKNNPNTLKQERENFQAKHTPRNSKKLFKNSIKIKGFL